VNPGYLDSMASIVSDLLASSIFMSLRRRKMRGSGDAEALDRLGAPRRVTVPLAKLPMEGARTLAPTRPFSISFY
jgi:hypothetical protein